MDNVIKEILIGSQSDKREVFKNSLQDLRLIIERYTQNRYSEDGISNYLLLFCDKSLISYRLKTEDVNYLKHYLFFMILNFPDRAVLIAKCIKVLFDTTIREAICGAIELYMEKDDDTTCELIFAITDFGDIQNIFSNKRIFNLFIEISKSGGENSREAVRSQLRNYKDYYS